MSKNKKPAKKYKPKHVSNPLAILAPVSKERRELVVARFYSALEAMTKSANPDNEEWRDLSDCINTIETLVTQGLLPREQVMPIVNECISHMVGAARRFQAGRGMRLDGAGISAIRTAIEVYDQACIVLTEKEMERAQLETERKIHEYYKSGKSEGVIAV
jgi:hypothetical protein